MELGVLTVDEGANDIHATGRDLHCNQCWWDRTSDGCVWQVSRPNDDDDDDDDDDDHDDDDDDDDEEQTHGKSGKSQAYWFMLFLRHIFSPSLLSISNVSSSLSASSSSSSSSLCHAYYPSTYEYI